MRDKCLIIIDAQFEFDTYDTDYTYGALSRFLTERHNEYKRIIATRYINNSDTACAKLLNWHACRKGSNYAGLESFVARVATDVIDKSTYSGAVEVYPLIGDMDVHICGFNTEACVLATAMALFDKCVDFKIISDLCNSTEGIDVHKAALQVMSTAFGKKRVVCASELI